MECCGGNVCCPAGRCLADGCCPEGAVICGDVCCTGDFVTCCGGTCCDTFDCISDSCCQENPCPDQGPNGGVCCSTAETCNYWSDEGAPEDAYCCPEGYEGCGPYNGTYYCCPIGNYCAIDECGPAQGCKAKIGFLCDLGTPAVPGRQ